MRHLAAAFAGLLALGALAACDELPQSVGRPRRLVETDDPPLPAPVRDPPTARASFRTRVIPAEAFDKARSAGVRYSPNIRFEIRDSQYSPRWPGATLAYTPGANPLSRFQRDLIGRAADSLNAAVGYRIFTMLADGASADIPVTDSTDFPKNSILGETEAKVFSRFSAASISIEVSERIHLRPRLPDGLFYIVALHELGHAAGLEHNPEPNSLMNAGTSPRTPNQFAPSELASLKLLYSLPDIPLEPPRGLQGIGAPISTGWILY